MAVQAYSAGGAGPWSAPFTGTTWSGDRELPLFFWSNPDSVYSMDMVGDKLKPVGRDTGNANTVPLAKKRKTGGRSRSRSGRRRSRTAA